MEGVVKFDQIFIFLCWNDSKGERGWERVGYMVLKRHFQQYLKLYRSGQFYWWRKPEYPEKIIDLP